MKVCPDCQLPLEASQFYANATHADGLSTRCRPCTSERVRLAYHARASLRQPLLLPTRPARRIPTPPLPY